MVADVTHKPANNVASAEKNLPLSQTILDMIQSGVDKDPGIVPSARLYADGFMDQAVLRKGLACNCNGCNVMINEESSTSYLIIINVLCLLIKATKDKSLLHVTYLTGGLLISAIVFCC